MAKRKLEVEIALNVINGIHGSGIQCSISSAGELMIYGVVGDTWDELDAETIIKQVQDLGEINDLHVRINSGGGYVIEGLAIYNFLNRLSANVVIHVDGIAASMASVLLMAGDERRMPENGMIMIHNPWDISIGDADQLRKDADKLDLMKNSLVSIYAAKTGLPVSEINAMMDAETWLNAQDAFDKGFIDVITEAVDSENLALVDVKAYTNVPDGFKAAASLKPGVKVTGQNPIAASGANTNEGTTMTDEERKAAEKAEKAKVKAAEVKAAAEAKATADKAAADARIAERNRGVEIRAAVATAKLPSTFADELVASEMSVADARSAIIDKWAEMGGPDTQSGLPTITVDERDKRVEAVSSATLARAGLGEVDHKNPFRGYRLNEVARSCAEASGVNTNGMMPDEYIRAAFRTGAQGSQTTSDFPVILEAVLHKMVLTGFDAQPSTWQQFCKTGDVTDFREWKRLVPGLMGDLDLVNEKGEYLNKNFPDAEANVNQVVRRGNILEVTPETIVNDDLGQIMEMANGLGAIGNRAIERAVYTLLNSNPVLADGIALFHASHNNLAGSGAVPSVISFDAAGSAMSLQTAPGDDAEYLDITPDICVANRSLRGQIRVIVNAQYDPDTANKLQKPNMVQGIVSDIVTSPRVTNPAWYFFAPPSAQPVIEVVFLNGQRSPRVVQEENFRTSGMAWKIELPFGVGAIDYRGAYKNPGV